MREKGFSSGWSILGAVLICLMLASLLSACGQKPVDTSAPADNQQKAVAFKTGDAPDIYAGKIDQRVAELIIEESAKGSLKAGQTITLQLPEGACWSAVPALDSAKSVSGGTNGSWTSTSPDARTIKYTASFAGGAAESSDAAKLYFRGGSIITKTDFSGEVKTKVSGSDGLASEVTLAQVVPGLNVSATTRDLKIGVARQAIGDITIAEVKAGMIGSQANIMAVTDQNLIKNDTTSGGPQSYIELIAPKGVTFSGLPKVEVVGDIEIDTSFGQARLFSEQDKLRIPVKSASSAPSKVILKDIRVTVNRTVSEGDLQITVGGTALIDQYLKQPDKVLFVPERNAGTVKAGTIITPAP
ncbi:MAG: hypothetical protein HPY50_04550 [Firmicutes bacterium]|nr:hypothetical protein [Bacillota bacterium]